MDDGKGVAVQKAESIVCGRSMNADQWAKVKAIFHVAIELPENERRQFVEQKSGVDADVFAEIRSLFDAHAKSDTFIEAPALESISHLVDADAKPSRIGQTFGAYTLEDLIGRGGMGAVYLASRTDKEFDKKVAVKLIKRGFDTDEIIRRFRHERQILAQLEHPNITRLLDGGSTGDGQPYLVMDYVEGLPLIKYCHENSLDIEARLELFLQICSAVAYAHRNLIVHRDLKPTNILVTSDGAPKLLDFGIAKLLSSDSDFTTARLATDAGIMTPDYASPEQIRGEPVTTATDIYSLGVLLYELLTGVRPFNLKEKSLERIVQTVCEVEPERPSTLAVRRKSQRPTDESAVIDSGIRNLDSRVLAGDLDNIVSMAMRKEPERRYSSVDQFAEDISRHRVGRPVLAQQSTFRYRASKFVRRNKTGVGAAIGILLALIGGIIGTYWQSRIAAAERDMALAQANKADRINEFLKNMLASADPRKQGRDVRMTEFLEIAGGGIERDFANEPLITADLQTTIGLTFLSLGKSDRAEPLLSQALDIRLGLLGTEHHDTAMSRYNFGLVLEAKGNAAEAETYYRASLETLRRLFGEKHLDIARVLQNLANVVAIQGRTSETIEILRETLEIRRSLLREDRPEIAEALTELGSALIMNGDPEAAEPLQRQALSIMQQNYGNEHPDTATALINLFASIQHRDAGEAERLANEALRIRRKFLGDNHPDVAWTLYNLSYLKISRGRPVEAERLAREILGLRGSVLSDENLLVSNALLILGRSLMEQNRLAEAEAILRECLELRRRNLPPEHWVLATTNSFLGECLMRRNQKEGGKHLLLESYARLKETLGEDHAQTRMAAERMKKFIR